PATVAVPSTSMFVVGAIACRAISAMASVAPAGASDIDGIDGMGEAGPGSPSGNVACLTTLCSLFQNHASPSWWMMSVSASSSCKATRKLSSPEYHTRAVVEPVSSDKAVAPVDPASPAPVSGRSGKPRSADCTTVPENATSRAPARPTRISAAVRSGSSESAPAMTGPTAAAVTTTAVTPAGTAHRIAGRRRMELGIVVLLVIRPSRGQCLAWCASTVRDLACEDAESVDPAIDINTHHGRAS